MRLFIALFSLALMFFAIIFAISNRFGVPLAFWPFPFTLTTPLFLICFLFFLTGFLCGWLNYFLYARSRQYAEIKDLREKLRYLKEYSILATNQNDETSQVANK